MNNLTYALFIGVILNHLSDSNFFTTRSIARPLCDSCASCSFISLYYVDWCGTVRGCYQWIVDACDAVVVGFRDHKRSQVGGVAGREDDGEQSPDARHEPAGHTTTTTTKREDGVGGPRTSRTRQISVDLAGHTTRIVDADGGAEQHRPDEPELDKSSSLLHRHRRRRVTR